MSIPLEPWDRGEWRPSRDFWSDRAVAVTGASGFVGSHLVSALVRLGASVVVLRRDDVPVTAAGTLWRDLVSEVHGRVEDQSVLERLLGDYEVSTVFHLAAQSQVGVANRNPADTFDTNVRGTWAILEAVRRSPTVGAVVVASSDKAYGDQPEVPYTERSPLRAVHPYDVSKACADLVAGSYAYCFGVPVTVTRCGNFFGPGDTNWARLIPGTIRSLLRGERPVIRSDGSMVRDYLYVYDGVRAYLNLAEAQTRDGSLCGEAFNFSLERPLSVLDVVDLLQTAAATSLAPDVRSTATNEIASQALSSAKARSVLGWSPAFDLEEALDETIAWYRGYVS